jgi:hypothetical protein
MPLTWDIGNTKAYAREGEGIWVKDEYGHTTVRAYIQTFIFWGGVVGYGRITEANAADYYGRSKAVEALMQDSIMHEWSEDGIRHNLYITPEMVDDMVGLSTNHGTYNITEWANRIAKYGNNVVEMPAKVIKAIVTTESWNYEQWVKAKKELANA